ncbi:hypothetical protein C815_01582 [Firmicutes bacterium M10-2]|nr:hypothetical protein C815_01582 [Firmicutes bacterium M10-2]
MKFKKIWTTMLCASVLTGCNNSNSFVAHYPETVKYSEENYEKWMQDREKFADQYEGYNEGLDDFVQEVDEVFFDTNANRTISPLNLYLCLSMVGSMSSGQTQSQILSLLHVDKDELEKKAHALWLANYADDGVVTCKLNNSLWLDQDRTFNDSLLSKIKDEYYASIYRGTMGSKEFDRQLQTWMNENTNNLLKDSIEQIHMDSDQIMNILSTIYYEGSWIHSFEKSENTEEVFHGTTKDKKATFMNQSLQTSYVDAKEYEAVGLGVGNSGTFWIVLPKNNVKSVWKSTETPMAQLAQVNLSMPKFDIQNTLSIKDDLEKLGINDAFDPNKADFSPLTDTDAYISDAEHGVRVKIDEEGIVAAGYTMFGMDTTSLIQEEVDVKVDRPFVFALQASDGTLLFCGQVMDLE